MWGFWAELAQNPHIFFKVLNSRYTGRMTHEESQRGSLQTPLFHLPDSVGNIELFPTVWTALEQFLSMDVSVRRQGLMQLRDLKAPRYSPLVAYVLLTRLTDPDISMRAEIVRLLGEVLAQDDNGYPAPEDVRKTISVHLAQMRTRQVYALLQVSLQEASFVPYLDRLYNACPFAGFHLAEILSDRKASLAIREQASLAIERVGFLDALPAVERLVARLESRVNGQGTMPFAPPSVPNETDLLPVVRRTLASLLAP
jgi:hypothetical protein